MKKIIRNLKKQWLLIWVIVAFGAVAVFSIVAYAEYLATVSNMHRVVVSKEGAGMRFSSNALIESGDSVYRPRYARRNDQKIYDVDLYVWNYGLDDLDSFYPGDINYVLQATLTDKNGVALDSGISLGSRTIKVLDQSDNELISFSSSNQSQTLSSSAQKLTPGYVEAQKYYKIRFSGWDIENDESICIQIKAIPTKDNNNVAYTDIRTISGVLGLKTSESSVTNGWKANINEKTATNSPNGFDAYNLVVSGSGSATITIKWNITKVDINKYFYASENNIYHFVSGEIDPPSETEGDWRTITIHADTGDSTRNYRNRYSLQIYKKDGEPSSWDELFAYNKSASELPDAWIRVNVN